MTKSNETVYDTDFVAGEVKEINTLYDGRPHSWSLEYPIEEKLPQVERLSIARFKAYMLPVRNLYGFITLIK